MRYIGSKVATLPQLTEILRRFAPDASSVCDPFAGTCSVARHLKRQGYQVSTGDILAASYAIQAATVATNRHPSFKKLLAANLFTTEDGPGYARVIAFLNSLRGKHGFISEHYSALGPSRRLFFSPQNAKRIDSIRDRIKAWSDDGLLSEREYAFLIATLVVSADKVANTAGTYYAYLKVPTRKAMNPLVLKPLEIFNNNKKNFCTRGNAADVVKSSSAEVLYLDPPYNDRDYASYYHLPETLSLGDRPDVVGKSGVPVLRRGPISEFCVPSRASGAFQNLIAVTRAKFIVVHYTPEGLISHETIMSSLRNIGRTTFKDIYVRKYTARIDDGRAGSALHRIYLCKA